METSVNATQETMATLKEIIAEVTLVKISPSDIHDSANLFNDCGLDSTSVIDLVIGIEDRLGVTIDGDEIDVTLFQDLSKLSSLIEAKKRDA